jgi:hypothetical protein
MAGPVLWAVFLAFGCGGSSGPSDASQVPPIPEAPATSVQDELKETDFWIAVEDDADLHALKDALVAEGFGTFAIAGAWTADPGLTLHYSAYANANGAEKAILRQCNDSGCAVAIAAGDGDAVAWTDGQGSPVPVVPMPVPFLLRQTLKQKIEDGTTLVSPLTEIPVVDSAAIDLDSRRLIVANQFGEAMSLKAADVAGALASGTRFSNVVMDDHVTWAGMQEYLTTSYPHEVLVFVSQPLRKLYKDNKDPALRWYRTVGYHFPRGVYGSAPVMADAFVAAVRAAPFSGPGLVLLIGGDSIGDASEGMESPDSTAKLLSFPGKVVAGFVHHAPTPVLLAAARKFLDGLDAGKTAAEARDATNALLEAWGEAARLKFNYDGDEGFKLLPDRASFWGDRVPKSATLSMFVHVRLYCANAKGQQTAVEEKQGQIGIANIAIDGPVFSGKRELEVNPGQFLRTEVRGVFGEIRAGAHFYFVLTGDVKEDYEGLTLYGNGVITKVTEAGSTSKVQFKGVAEALPFVNKAGVLCTLPDTYLEPIVEGSLSEMVLSY